MSEKLDVRRDIPFIAESFEPSRNIPFVAESIHHRKRTLEIGNTLFRKRKGYPNEPAEAWAIVRDVITAPKAPDSTEYVAVLCEGVETLAGQWFVWRTYFTNNRYGKLSFGQFGPQAPLAIDKWLTDEIFKRGWYAKTANGGNGGEES